MNEKQAQEKIKNLCQEIQKHNHLYHTKDQPQISDYEYDRLFAQLLDLEAQFPNLKSKNSPTGQVGSKTLKHFQKMAHKKPMLSLQNTYSTKEIIEFEKKMQRQLNTQDPLEFFCSPKYDGVAIELIYQKGQLTHALTRGDGFVGEDVLSNVQCIKTLPHKLKTPSPPERLDIRGEILIFKKELERINEQQNKNKAPSFANPRNAAAGTLRQLNPKVASQRDLQIFCYSFGYGSIDFSSQEEFEVYLEKVGLPHTPFLMKNPLSPKNLSQFCHGAQQVIQYYNSINNLRVFLPFEIDGIVAKLNSFTLQNQLGSIARSPRWAFAVKFSPDQATTVVKDIHVQVGRTGALTPVALVQPVRVGGVTIRQASLHNQGEIQRKDIRIGDTVFIQRAGDVIPEILKPILEKRPKNSQKFQIPQLCPCCNKKTQKLLGEAVRRCTNPLCPAMVKESLKHFVSRKAMNIEKLGSQWMENLYEASLVKKFSDIYKLTLEDLLTLERQGEKSALNIINSIEGSRKPQLSRFIYALGIRFVGEQTAYELTQHFGSVQSFLKAQKEDLETLPGIGPKVTSSLIQTLGEKEFQKEVNQLLLFGVDPQTSPSQKGTQQAKDQPLEGLSFVITGTLPQPRQKVSQLIREAGGKVISSMGQKKHILIAGEKGGSKLQKAQKLGNPIWSWMDLERKLKV